MHGDRVQTFDDLRLAMAFALAGLRVPGIVIENPGCVAKSFPEFFDVLAQVGHNIGGVRSET
jgi:3-phosphoshikimate 1-carboxyvinyltransferase